MPTALYLTIPSSGFIDKAQLLLNVSHAIALILLSLYCLYLCLSLKTHRSLYEMEESEAEEEDPEALTDYADLSLGPTAAMAWLIVSLALIALCTFVLLMNLQGSISTTYKTFLGFILFPFLGNTTDFFDACVVAWRNELDITIGVTLGSSMQVMLFTLPFQVILGWIIGQDMTLELDLFNIAAVFLGVVIVGNIVLLGKSNYFYGATCIAL